jgi:hypothetical protein
LTDSPAARAAVPRAPGSERAVDGACIVFALWTVCCHVVVVLGGSLWAVLGLFGSAGLVLLGVRVARRGAVPATPQAGAPEAESPVRERRPALRLAGLLLGVAGAVVLRGSPVALWWWSLGLLGAALVLFVAPEVPRAAAPARSRALEIGLWALALVCVAITLVSHRVDIDDAFYVNLAAAAADAPADGLLVEDTLHGVPGLPLHHPTYRVQSYEIWNGALALLTGIPAIACFHFVSAGLAALLVPLAWARLFRRLLPRHWLWAVAGLVWVLLAAGDAHRWYGNFAFVRMWQGKAVFLSVFLPLVWAYALDFALRPTHRTWWLLAAAQVAALGCSSSAVWAAPAAALAAACSALRPDRHGWRRLAVVMLASIYVLGIGVAVRETVSAERQQREAARSEQSQARATAERAALHAAGRQLHGGLQAVTGGGRLAAVSLAALLAAWACVGPGLARRFAVVVPLAGLLVLFNPYATDWISRNAVGPSYWRAFWVLPIPALLALMLTAPLEPLARRPWLGRAATLVALALFALLPLRSTLSEKNGVTLALPRLKVPQEAYRLAEIFTDQVSPGATVVAPMAVSVWLSTFHDRLHPLVVRDWYLVPFRKRLGKPDLQLRMLMTLHAAGNAKDPRASYWFGHGLARYDVGGVFLYVTPEIAEVREVLHDAGFEPTFTTPRYEIWVRS